MKRAAIFLACLAMLFLFTGAAARMFSDVDYAESGSKDIYLCFGRESAGIDPAVLASFPERCVRIPMAEGKRSLNLANSVAIGVYEALRQLGYPGLLGRGEAVSALGRGEALQ